MDQLWGCKKTAGQAFSSWTGTGLVLVGPRLVQVHPPQRADSVNEPPRHNTQALILGLIISTDTINKKSHSRATFCLLGGSAYHSLIMVSVLIKTQNECSCRGGSYDARLRLAYHAYKFLHMLIFIRENNRSVEVRVDKSQKLEPVRLRP